MRTKYPRHLAGASYVGFQRYSLTFCTYTRQRHFNEAGNVDLARAHIMRTALDEWFAVIAYCFMPDHLHLVMEGRREDADLKRFIKQAKQASAYWFSNQFGERLWQRYGYEHTLRADESTRRTVRYVLENPVRAGLVKHPRDYPFIGSSEYSLEDLLRFAYESESA